MVRRVNGRPAWLVVFLVLAAVALAVPAFAQNGMVKGTVRDEKGQPVDGAKVSIAQNGGTGRKFETKSDKKGEFIQIGLPSGQYAVTAEKDKLASPPSTVGVSVGTPAEVALVVSRRRRRQHQGLSGSGRRPEKDLRGGRRRQQWRQARRGDRRSSSRASPLNSNCADCYNNIGYSYTPDEAVRQGRGSLQEGDRNPSDRCRGLQRPRQRLQRAAQGRSRGRRPAPRRPSCPGRGAAAAATPTRSSTRASSCSTAARAARPSRCSSRS